MWSAPRSTHPAARALALAWAQALGRVLDPAPDPAALQAQLIPAAQQLLHGPDAADAVGAALVGAGLGTPEVLGATVQVLGAQLPAPATAVLARLCVGFARASREQSRNQLRQATLHDALTGLPNRVLFADRLDTLFANARPGDRVGICFIDIDGFTMVNDQFGHQVGDLVLVTVADRLRRLADDTGHLVARFSGDEFAILVPTPTGADDVIAVAERALSMLAPPVEVTGHTVQTQASIGVVERRVADGDATDLLRAADMTLHWAKSDPDRGWQLYDGERSAREVAGYALLGDLPTALERREIVAFYQPLVRLHDNRVVGYEALARWRHPHLGVLGPDRFITLAERSGLIVPLGARLLSDACRAAAGWRADTGDGAAEHYVSVNVAVRQIRHGALVDTVAAILAETGLPAHRLQLEITESDSVDKDHRSHASLQELARLGVRLAIDDFGSGYSNLGYLQAMPLNQLKIDGRFLAEPARGRSLLPTLVDLAHTLGVTALVEGVETGEQAAYLTAIGCDLGQGWHFGRPRPTVT